MYKRQLYDRMVEYYKDNPNVTVIVDRREGADRRKQSEARLEDLSLIHI